MKKLLPIALSIVLLAGCGTGSNETAATKEETTEAIVQAAAVSTAEGKEEEKGEEFSKEDYAWLWFDISYNPDGTAGEVDFLCRLDNEKDSYVYATEWYKSEFEEGGLSQRITDINGEYETYNFLFETNDMQKAMGQELYQAVIEQYRDVIENVLQEQIQKCEREGTDGALLLGDFTWADITDRMPKKLVLNIDDKSIEMDVAQASQSLAYTETEEEEPVGTALPYWKDADGDYHRASGIRVTFIVPKEQTRPLTDFLDAIAEEEKKLTPEEQRERNNEYEKRKKAEAAAGGNGQAASSIGVVGTWYDPTGYSVAVYTFREDGTGIEDLGSVTISFTYTVSGNTLSYTFKGHTSTLTISGDKLVGGAGETYIKR